MADEIPTADTPQLKQGAQGTIVAILQVALQTLLGRPAKVDGVYGPDTTEAVKIFQRAVGLPVTGIVGPETNQAFQGVAAAARAGQPMYGEFDAEALARFRELLAKTAKPEAIAAPIAPGGPGALILIGATAAILGAAGSALFLWARKHPESNFADAPAPRRAAPRRAPARAKPKRVSLGDPEAILEAAFRAAEDGDCRRTDSLLEQAAREGLPAHRVDVTRGQLMKDCTRARDGELGASPRARSKPRKVRASKGTR